MKKDEWTEFTPDIVWIGSTAPSGNTKSFYKKDDNGIITVKIDFETHGNITGFELKQPPILS